MRRKLKLTSQIDTVDDPEHLQAMDESNKKWVNEWKKTVKKSS